MRIKDIVAPLEQFAPLAWQEEFDNSGLIVGRGDDEAESALVCLDVTGEVLDEAEKLGAGLVISHHPAIFHPLRRLDGEGLAGQVVERAIRSGIALYACHTNLDNAPGGVSSRLAEMLGVVKVRVLAAADPSSSHGTGVVGSLAEAVEAMEFLRQVQRQLDVKAIRYSYIAPSSKIHRVAVCGGSGAPFIGAARSAGADIYLAADFKYHDFVEAGGVAKNAVRGDGGDGAAPFVIADIGHWESEFCAIELICEVISKKIANFALYKSKSSRNPVGYLLSGPEPGA